MERAEFSEAERQGSSFLICSTLERECDENKGRGQEADGSDSSDHSCESMMVITTLNI